MQVVPDNGWAQALQEYGPRNLWWHLASYVRNESYLLSVVMSLRPRSILEVGAGTGRGCILLKRLLPDAKVVATDIDPECCKLIAENALACGVDVEIAACDVHRLPYGDKQFDACFSVGLLEHLGGPDEIVAAVKEQLRIAAIVIIEVPLLHWLLRNEALFGDELIMTKGSWVRLMGGCANILDMCFVAGEKAEEKIASFVLSGDIEATLPATTSIEIKSGQAYFLRR